MWRPGKTPSNMKVTDCKQRITAGAIDATRCWGSHTKQFAQTSKNFSGGHVSESGTSTFGGEDHHGDQI